MFHGETGFLVPIEQSDKSPFEPRNQQRFERNLAARHDVDVTRERPVGTSYFSYTTFCPSIFRNATLLTTGLTASALVPSAEMATWATLSPIATVSFRQIQGLREDKAAVNMKYLFLAFFALLLLFVGGFYHLTTIFI